MRICSNLLDTKMHINIRKFISQIVKKSNYNSKQHLGYRVNSGIKRADLQWQLSLMPGIRLLLHGNRSSVWLSTIFSVFNISYKTSYSESISHVGMFLWKPSLPHVQITTCGLRFTCIRSGKSAFKTKF